MFVSAVSVRHCLRRFEEFEIEAHSTRQFTNHVTDNEQERGEEHIRETYTDLVTNQLYENPNPTADSYYCSKDGLRTRLHAELDTAYSVAERAGTITDFDAWKPTDVDEDDENEYLHEEWQRDLGRWLTDIARAKQTGRMYATELQRGDYQIDHADESMTAFDVMHARLHDALEAVDDLPADVTTDLINRLDDAVVAAITGN
ncbi:hypothetical protein [Halomicrococcus sp. SG-WS-1]|uniref:hypothetical protein n=1 Tax=Halomicrococcus sp. SG-WS-1 TaxID=3439057 RepID=UPI003F790668